MANSLADQLLKAGLVDKQKVSQANAKKRKQAKQKKGNKSDAPEDEAAIAARKAQKEKAARDRELNRKKAAEAERQALHAQVRQLIDSHKEKDWQGEIAYNFVEGSKLTRIHVTEAAQKALAEGQLAIVLFDQRHHLVPAELTERLRKRMQDLVIIVAAPDVSDQLEDDYYKQFEVPDDLIW